MSKQDRQGVRTAAELERKYEFADQTHNATEARRAAADAQAAASEAQAAVGMLKDYITLQGVIGAWHYEKWASGKAVCWCITDIMAVEFATQLHSAAFYASVTHDLPSELFIEPPSFVSVDTYAAEGFYGNSINSITASAIVWSALEHTEAATTRNVQFIIQAKGRWK